MSENTIKKLTEEHKHQIISLIEAEAIKLGSQTAVAKKCQVSDATIDQLRKNKYTAKGDDMWLKVGAALSWNPNAWNVVVDTLDTQTVLKVLSDAKSKSMFMAISNRAGSGKSTACKMFLRQFPNETFYIECGEWNKRIFLNNLCRCLGVDPRPGFPTQWLLEKVLHFFQTKVNRPLLIIDQANSLQPNVLSFMIELYNACEDKLGLVLSGTPHLQHMIKKGVARNSRFYDEIDSRLGRQYITLSGSTLSDIRKICTANGVLDAVMQDKVWNECEREVYMAKTSDGDRKLEVVTDMRRLKRIIQKYQLIIEKNSVI